MAADDSRTADAVAALFAPDPAVAAHSAVRAVRRIARDVLAPHAPAADDPARGVDPAHLALLAEAGQLAVTVPAEEGGLGGDVRVGIETVELLSGACGATWFVVTQHQMPQAVARGTLGLGDRWTAGPAVERNRAGALAPGGPAPASPWPTSAAPDRPPCALNPTARVGG